MGLQPLFSTVTLHDSQLKMILPSLSCLSSDWLPVTNNSKWVDNCACGYHVSDVLTMLLSDFSHILE